MTDRPTGPATLHWSTTLSPAEFVEHLGRIAKEAREDERARILAALPEIMVEHGFTHEGKRCGRACAAALAAAIEAQLSREPGEEG